MLGVGMAVLASGCATTGDSGGGGSQAGSSIPTWVSNPTYKDGIAATECMAASSNFSLDRKEAVANARQGLAQQLDLKVEAMDKTYQRRTRSEQDKASTGTSFESVSRQVTQTELNGSRTVKTGYVNLAGEKNLCVMVALGDSEMRKIFDGLIEASGREVNAKDEEILYEEFRAQKAQDELDEELEE